MIRRCTSCEFEQIYTIINDAAQAYKGVIPADCWTEPYMSAPALQQELDAGVVFWGSAEGAELSGVMGLQETKDITLIRHAYVLPSRQRRGLGAQLLSHLRAL
ncbi:MAG: GNAT family N-acetyltransferase, partial [Acidobacteria bacterium]|nr:GNAT family N-acetyltransferase [Acidobacteriota bacterium]